MMIEVVTSYMEGGRERRMCGGELENLLGYGVEVAQDKTILSL